MTDAIEFVSIVVNVNEFAREAFAVALVFACKKLKLPPIVKPFETAIESIGIEIVTVLPAVTENTVAFALDVS